MQGSLHEFLYQCVNQVANLGHRVLSCASVQLANERLTHLGYKLAINLHDLDQLTAIKFRISLHLLN